MDKIYYTKPSISDLEIRYAIDAVTNGWGDKCYDYIHRFESNFAEHLGVKHAIATSSCTGAIHLGLAGLGIGTGDEIILADTNWIASAAPATYLGATPVFVDISPETWCLSPENVEQAITPKTKAILAVHLYGNVCDMQALLDIGQRYGIPIIEDAAEAIGARYQDKAAGSIGLFGAFSFHGTKTITTGEGGMFVTNDSDFYDKVLTLSNHGRDKKQTRQFWPDKIGFKYKMSNVEAAIGCAQLERVEQLIEEKAKIFQMYRSAFGNSNIQLNPLPSGPFSPGYWMVNAVLPRDAIKGRRENLLSALASIGADARVFFWPLTSTGHFEKRYENPVAYDTSCRSINLPSPFGLTQQVCELVSSVVLRFSHSSTEMT